MEGFQFLGVFAFIYGILWATSVTRDAKRALDAEHLARVRPIERPTVLNSAGPLVPLIAGLGVATWWPATGMGIGVAAIVTTVALLALRGVLHARRMEDSGIPPAYWTTYRKAHAIRAASLALCAATLLHPLLA